MPRDTLPEIASSNRPANHHRPNRRRRCRPHLRINVAVQPRCGRAFGSGVVALLLSGTCNFHLPRPVMGVARSRLSFARPKNPCRSRRRAGSPARIDRRRSGRPQNNNKSGPAHALGSRTSLGTRPTGRCTNGRLLRRLSKTPRLRGIVMMKRMDGRT